MPSVFYLFVCFVFCCVFWGWNSVPHADMASTSQTEPLYLDKPVCPSSLPPACLLPCLPLLPASCLPPPLCHVSQDATTIFSPCQECSQRANNGRFTLRDLLMVPMQRVLKYHLLLQVPAQGWVPWVWLGDAIVYFVATIKTYRQKQLQGRKHVLGKSRQERGS